MQIEETVELVGSYSIMLEGVHGFKGSKWVKVVILAKLLPVCFNLSKRSST